MNLRVDSRVTLPNGKMAILCPCGWKLPANVRARVRAPAPAAAQILTIKLETTCPECGKTHEEEQ